MANGLMDAPFMDLISEALANTANAEVQEPQEGCVDKNAQTAAIVVAGGSGERFGAVGGKQLVDIAGKPMLTWSIDAFDRVGDVGLIVVLCPKDRMEEYRAVAIEPFNFVTPIVMAEAGDSRQESAFSGLEAVPDTFEYTLVHAGARPLVSPNLAAHAISALKGNIDADGVVLATPAVDTLKLVQDGVIMGTPDRKVLWNAQTPQVFRTSIYRRAHASALSDGFSGTDDSSLIERLGGRVLIVEGRRDNIKLTVPEDALLLATAVNALRVHSQEPRQDLL